MVVRNDSAARDMESSEATREKKMRKRGTDYNPWGVMVAQLITKRQMSIRQVGEKIGEMGFYRKHPVNALNHAMQMKGIKAVTYTMTVCVGKALELDPDEWNALHDAGTNAGSLALELGEEPCDIEESVIEAENAEHQD